MSFWGRVKSGVKESCKTGLLIALVGLPLFFGGAALYGFAALAGFVGGGIRGFFFGGGGEEQPEEEIDSGLSVEDRLRLLELEEQRGRGREPEQPTIYDHAEGLHSKLSGPVKTLASLALAGGTVYFGHKAYQKFTAKEHESSTPDAPPVTPGSGSVPGRAQE